MLPHAREMNVARATTSALVLLGASIVGVVLGDQATDPIVVAGGVGVIIAASLLGLTMLAARWRRGSRRYESAPVNAERIARVEGIASAFDVAVPEIGRAAEDSAAV